MPEFIRTLLYALRAVRYTGNNVTCPVCNRSFRKFIPGGNDRRPNARCPACDALERHRLFGLFLKRKTSLLSGNQPLLHFAPERCFWHLFSGRQRDRYITADLQSPLAAVHTDITNLVFTDQQFDAIICLHVLEHISSDVAALGELYRVLKPGGEVLIMTPVDQTLELTVEDREDSTEEERTRRFGAPDHLRLYGRDFSKRLENAGFSVEAVDFYGELDDATRRRYVLLPEELIYRCTKPV